MVNQRYASHAAAMNPPKRILAGGLSLTLALASLAPETHADTVELEPVADVAVLYSATPPFRQNLLNGGKAPIGASIHSGGSRDRGSCSLLRFDVEKIPAGAKIEKVSLILTPSYTYAASVYDAQERLSVYQLTPENAAWVEGVGESFNEPETVPITVPGANGAYLNMESYEDDEHHTGTTWLSTGKHIGLMDFVGDELAAYPLSEIGLSKDQSISIDIPPSVIENWQKEPDLAKAGLALWMHSDNQGITEQSKFAIFQSREEGNPPRLVVEYSRH